MTLFRKLMLSIALLVLLLLSANGLVSIVNAQTHFSDQLRVLAEDTATSLGLSISHAAQLDDMAQINSMIDVIFDRGYYQDISFRDFDGKAIVERHRSVEVDGVPDWFIAMVPIRADIGSAEVVSGWMRLGVIEVNVHPGYAYRDLWNVVIQQVWLFLIAAVVSAVLASLGLKYLLKPLVRVERQAEAICRKEFPIQEELPNTPELKRMVLAMNRMVQKIQGMFAQQVELTEALRRESHMDPLTEIPNRKEFDARLEAWMKSEVGGAHSILLLLHIGGLEKINDHLGRDAGDELVSEVASVLKHLIEDWPDAIPARRAGGDFSVFIPGVLVPDAIPVLDRLKQSLFALESYLSAQAALDAHDEVLDLHFGVASSQAVCKAKQLLSAADLSLRAALDSGGSEWCVYPVEEAAGDIRPAGEWLKYLQQTLDSHSLVMHFQPVLGPDRKTVLQYESFARITDRGKVLNAGAFWPLVERYGFVEQMDKAVAELVLSKMVGHRDAAFCINLSQQAVTNEEFQSWLVQLLNQSRVRLDLLTLELPEKVLRLPLVKVKQFVDRVKAVGVKVSLDHFGVTPSSLGILQSLQFDWVKLDRRFTSHIDAHSENRFYIKSLLQIAQSCDVKVIAEGIEHEKDWEILLELGVDGGQGYLFAAPAETIA